MAACKFADCVFAAQVGIIKQFPFSSALQRMAVLCKQMGGEQVDFFCKGSPEMVQSLSKPETGDMFTNVSSSFCVF